MAKPVADSQQRPHVTILQHAGQSSQSGAASESGKPKKKRPRGGKNRNKRNRRQSFAAPSETTEGDEMGGDRERPSLLDTANPRALAHNASFYRLRTDNRSNTSLESEALLDHRDQAPMSKRRQSVQQRDFFRPNIPQTPRHRGSHASGQPSSYMSAGRSKVVGGDYEHPISEGEDDEDDDARPTECAPLLGSHSRTPSKPKLSRNNSSSYGGTHGTFGRSRRQSMGSNVSSRRGRDIPSSRGRLQATVESDEEYDVNNPPSRPTSPGGPGNLDDVMIAQLTGNPDSRERGRDAVIDIDDTELERRYSSGSPDMLRRRGTTADQAQRDVCYPPDAGMSEIADEDVISADDRHSPRASSKRRHRRRRGDVYPKLWVIEQHAAEEKEVRTEHERMRRMKLAEPVMIGGRLRRGTTQWQREEQAPYRFTYFNEAFDETIHASTLSELVDHDEDITFKHLFQPDPFDLSDSEGDETAVGQMPQRLSVSGPHLNGRLSPAPPSSAPPMQALDAVVAGEQSHRSPSNSRDTSGRNTPMGRSGSGTPRPHVGQSREKKMGHTPVWWLDIMAPTEEEMRTIARTFGIHQLTVEDILMSEEREKVELFQTYYFVNYRSFEQDKSSDDYLEPLNIYAVVYRDYVLTFHHSMTPHMNNVRRRIRQLNDYMNPSADWISYALIDDITDAYAPLVRDIEEEVDVIDDEILYIHEEPEAEEKRKKEQSKGNTKSKIKKLVTWHSEEKGLNTTQADMGAHKVEGEKTAGESGGDMLRRVGECRKKVMSMYRLLGNKADVIKGFAKRCNEHWEVAPKSEIGLYLGDIQDHIVTMTGNLSHYENLLSRAHSNYLAQINIRMNERAEQTADVLGKLTVLGTIVLPMNIITGMWGMNVWVPGQEYEGDLTWFWCITAGLVAFGLSSYFIAKKVYGIV
ncbi:cora-domain-containing protein [Teratosphaeria nubilosa]|uniref:Cora-domain-containing protein n=1 Tax=Teratosphaeria nubilosa TaxID=161662 RepID=A0A6G1LM07_9PEZI|nr:cora-domain-containing protein [Teratosphaeria nubilosa]